MISNPALPSADRYAPRAFVRRRWAPYVFGEHDIDRHYYELGTVSELRNTLRAGDVWVSGSRQFKDFEDYLIPAAAFDALAKRQELPVAVPANFEAFWNERCERLDRELEAKKFPWDPNAERKKQHLWIVKQIGKAFQKKR